MKTIPELFEKSAGKYENNPYLLEKRTEKYMTTTFGEARKQAYRFAAGLLSMGISKGDRIALLSESRTDWVISELGVLHTGAVSVPLSILLKEGADLKFRLDHSGSRWIIVSILQYAKIKPIKNELPNLEKIILIDQKENQSDDEISMEEVKKKGDEYLKLNNGRFIEIMKSKFKWEF